MPSASRLNSRTSWSKSSRLQSLKIPSASLLASRLDCSVGLLPLLRDHRLPHARIGRARTSRDEPQLFEARHLPAHGAVVAANPARQVHHTDRAEPFHQHEQRKERALER